METMSWVYRSCVRPWLFTHESEAIHNQTLDALAWMGQRRFFLDAAASFLESPPLPTRVMGLEFPNPVGLAAGMDKQAAAVPMWEAMGFGFCELGGVTWHPQEGNPAPRMFRAVEDEALVNRMGFNNGGAEALAARLADWQSSGNWPHHPVGINLGKSKITPLGEAPAEYARTFARLRDLADFFVVNVSSPNTPNLRQLQDKDALSDILQAIQEQNRTATASAHGGHPAPSHRAPRPVLVKIAPDLAPEAIDEILEVAARHSIAGLVATNTTVTRPGSATPVTAAIYSETGGMSGRPLAKRSTEVIRHVHKATGGKLPIIGVGGIFNAADAWEKITAGASLVQVYTGLVYEGPAIAQSIVKGLRDRLESTGIPTLTAAVGIANR